jgi:hypothetical protein
MRGGRGRGRGDEQKEVGEREGRGGNAKEEGGLTHSWLPEMVDLLEFFCGHPCAHVRRVAWSIDTTSRVTSPELLKYFSGHNGTITRVTRY